MHSSGKWVFESIIGVIALFAVTGRAGAETLFSNLGPGDSWDHGTAYVLHGPDGGPPSTVGGKAMPFTSPITAELTSIELPLGDGLLPGTNRYIVELRANSQGKPGAVLESFTFENLGWHFDPDQSLSVGTSVAHPVLQSNTTYWVAAFPGASNASGGWNWSSPIQTGTWAGSADGGATWEFNPFGRREIAAFRVNGVPVPEPGSSLALGVSVLLLAGPRRRK